MGILDLLYSIHYYMFHFWNIYGDVRLVDLFLCRYGLYLPLFILGSYIIFVTKVGPQMMKNREAFKLKWILVFYNSSMVAVNAVYLIQALIYLNFGLDIFEFDYPDRNDFSELAITKITLTHYYLLTKFLDLFDTIFFVLRKKQTQVTKMHLYHHISVPAFGWAVWRISALLPPLAIFILFNTLIHTIMYLYYALAALGPTMQPYLWWKKYVTLLQIYQFVIYTAFSCLFAYKQKGYPVSFQILAYTQPLIFLTLFVRFYLSTYKQGKNTRAKLKD